MTTQVETNAGVQQHRIRQAGINGGMDGCERLIIYGISICQVGVSIAACPGESTVKIVFLVD